MNIDLVKKLRQETGQGVMECRKALQEAGGDFEKAKQILASKVEKIATKKSERTVKSGMVEVYSHSGKIGVIVEVLCESDFVARNPEFKEFAHELALQIASMDPKDIDELKKEPWIRDESKTIGDLIKEKIMKFGENIKINRFCRVELRR